VISAEDMGGCHKLERCNGTGNCRRQGLRSLLPMGGPAERRGDTSGRWMAASS
jgi:hypothetical protein